MAAEKGQFLQYKPAPFRADLPSVLNQLNKDLSKCRLVPPHVVALFIHATMEFGCRVMKEGLPCDEYWEPLQTTFKAMISKFKWDQKLQKIALQLDAVVMMSRIYYMKEDYEANFECNTTILKVFMATISRDTHSRNVAAYMTLVLENIYICVHKTANQDFDMLLSLLDRLIETYEKKSLCKNDKVFATLLEKKMYLHHDKEDMKKGLKAGRSYLKFLNANESSNSVHITKCLFHIGLSHYELENYELAYEVNGKAIERTHKHHKDFRTDKTLLGHFFIALSFVENCAIWLKKKQKDEFYQDFFDFIDSMTSEHRKLLKPGILEHLETGAVTECMEKVCLLNPERLLRVAASDKSSKIGGKLIYYIVSLTQRAQKQCQLGNHFEAIEAWENARYLIKNFHHGMMVTNLNFDRLWQCYAFHVDYVPEAFELATSHHKYGAKIKPNKMLIKLYEASGRMEEALELAWEFDQFQSPDTLMLALNNDIQGKYYRRAIRNAKALLRHRDLRYDRFETVEEYFRFYEQVMLKYCYCLRQIGSAIDGSGKTLSDRFNKISRKERDFGVKGNGHHGRYIHCLVYLDPQTAMLILADMLRRCLTEEPYRVQLYATSFFDKNTPFHYCKIFIQMITKAVFWSSTETRAPFQQFANSLSISLHLRINLTDE